MKKWLKALSAVCLLSAFTTTACFASSNNIVEENTIVDVQLPEYEEVVTDAVNQNDIMALNLESKAVLYHNNGNAMTSDYISTESDDDYLVAIYQSTINGVPYESAYFSETPKMEKEELLQTVTSGEENFLMNEKDNVLEQISDGLRAGETQTKRETWVVNKGFGVEANIVTSMVLTRYPNVPHNNQDASLWTISATTSYTKANARRLNNFSNRLRVDGTGQTLIDWGPKGDIEGTDLSGSLTYGSFPSVDYHVAFGGFKMTDDTDHFNNYALWNYKANIGSNKNLAVTPAIVASNTSGTFYIGVRNDVDINASDGTRYTDIKTVGYTLTDR